LKTLATRLIPIALALASLTAWAQSPGMPQPGGQGAQPVQANLNMIIAQVQKAAMATNADLGKLRIEKWKTDAEQKDQLQKMSDSIQRNLTNAIPGLIGDIQSSRGNVSATFKLYHNITIVYEYLTSLTDAAGVLGKKEEYEPLAADAAALDSARENLSTYIQQQATTYESRVGRRHRAVPLPRSRESQELLHPPAACVPLPAPTASNTSSWMMCPMRTQLQRRKRLPSLPPPPPASPPPRPLQPLNKPFFT